MSNNEIIDLVTNKKAKHLYQIIDTYEAGIVLTGTEVKACRENKINFKDSYIEIKGGETFLKSLHIGPYKNGTTNAHNPERVRKLLLHKKEILKLEGKASRGGYTIVPLKFYIKGNKIKVKIALVAGKKKYDRREDYKKKESEIQINREIKKNLQKKFL